MPPMFRSKANALVPRIFFRATRTPIGCFASPMNRLARGEPLLLPSWAAPALVP